MPIFNFSTINEFWQALKALSSPYKILATSYLILTVMYPGQNDLQTLSILDGPIRSFAAPILELADYPTSNSASVPFVSARSVIVQDVDSKAILLKVRPDESLMPASTTKLMTALVALDNYSLDSVVTITSEDHAVGHSMNLQAGETITIKNLLYGLLVESGNDAALALAQFHPGGYDGFISAMNKKADALGLTRTSFRNPSGVESYGHLTSARDLAVLASYALSNSLVREIVNTKSMVITDTKGSIEHHLVNTNKLLGELEGVQGMKTGWTENAGECLVTYVERGGRGIIIVVLGSRDRFGDTRTLVDWAYSHHTWQKPE